MIQANNEQPLHCIKRQDNLSGIITPPIWYSFPSRYRNAYINEMEHFLKLVQGEVQPTVHPNEILAVCKIATAAEQSARCAKPILLSWDD